MAVKAGWCYRQGDPPGTKRYWNGTQWTTGPQTPNDPEPTRTQPPTDDWSVQALTADFPTGPAMTAVENMRPNRTPWQWFTHVLTNKYASFDGRARRAEFWWYTIIQTAIMFALAAATVMLSFSDITLIIGFIVFTVAGLGFIIPTLAATVRRLHDIGRSGALVFCFDRPADRLFLSCSYYSSPTATGQPTNTGRQPNLDLKPAPQTPPPNRQYGTFLDTKMGTTKRPQRP